MSDRNATRPSRRLPRLRTGRVHRPRCLPGVEGLEARELMSYGGSPDLTFGTLGYVNVSGPGTRADYVPFASAAQSDGKMVEVGFNEVPDTQTNGDGTLSLIVARFHTDGTSDTTFGTAGFFTSSTLSRAYPYNSADDEVAYQLAFQTDGKIVVVGDSLGVATVLRLDTDGTLDSTFGTGGIVSLGTDDSADGKLDIAGSVAIEADGTIAVGGDVEPNSSTKTPAIEKLNANGSIDTTFGTGGLVLVPLPAGASALNNATIDTSVATLVQPDGKVLAVTNATQGTSPTSNLIEIVATRFNVDGTLDTTFGTGGQAAIAGSSILSNGLSLVAAKAALQPDGKLVIAGGTSYLAGAFLFPHPTVLRLDANGTLDPSFGIGGADITALGPLPNTPTISDLAIQADGKIVISFTNDSALTRFDADGLPDPSFGTGGTILLPPPNSDSASFSVIGFSVLADGEISASLQGGGNYLARLLGQGADGDFDDDGKTDPAVLLTTTASVAYRPSGGGQDQIDQIGDPGAPFTLPAPGAYNGAGISELAVYRPGSGTFDVKPYSGGPDMITAFGTPGLGNALPAPGDYDGSGRTELAVYSPAQGAFFYRPNNGAQDVAAFFGLAGAGQSIPAPADYFNTGVTDFAVYLVAQGAYEIRNPVTGEDYTIPFGTPGAGQSIPVPGDYDGSGHIELAVYVPASGDLIYRPANGGADVIVPFGTPGVARTIPAPGDYDGSGHTEVAGYETTTGMFSYLPAAGGAPISIALGTAGETVPFSLGTDSVAESGTGNFVAGDYYASNGTAVVTHYSQGGTILGSFRVSGPAVVGGLKGVAFDPGNELLYASSSNANGNLTVVALNSFGVIQQTYTTGSPTGGNIDFGKLSFDTSGHLYVGDGVGVHQFTVGTLNDGNVIYNQSSNGAKSIVAMPDGDLIVAGDDEISEITTAGVLVKKFTPEAGAPGFVNLLGLAFDAATNSLYVSMLGYTGEFDQVEKFDYATGELLAHTTFGSPDSLFLTTAGDLLIGSGSQAPALYGSDLHYREQFDGGSELFVTQG